MLDAPTVPIPAVRPAPRVRRWWQRWPALITALLLAASVTVLVVAIGTAAPATGAPSTTPVATAPPTSTSPAPTYSPPTYSPPPATSTSDLRDQLMLNVIRDNTAVTAPDRRLLALAEITCTNLNNHPTAVGALGTIQGMQDITGWSGHDAAFVVGVAIANRCPEHADLITG